MKNRVLVVNHGPGEVRAVIVNSPSLPERTPVRTELLPPHTQQEIIFGQDQEVLVQGD